MSGDIMIISKKIKLNDNIYYVIIDLYYKKKDNITMLCLKDFQDEYYDDGDFTKLISIVEDNYSYEQSKSYDKYISFMGDVLYVYDRIPFLKGIKEIYNNNTDNTTYSTSYISKEEIENYIIDNNIKMNLNSNFKLYDEKTWKI